MLERLTVPQAEMPAMFITTSIAPCSSVTRRARRRTASWSLTSAGSARSTTPPAAVMPAAVAASRVRVESVRNEHALPGGNGLRGGAADAAGGTGDEDLQAVEVT